MLTINLKQACYPLILVLTIALIPILSSADAATDKTGEKWIKKVKLKKNARINGFMLKLIKGGVPSFEAVNVTDPVTKKLVEGKQKLEYRCKEDNIAKTVSLIFSKGNAAGITVACTDLITPQIIIMEEEEQPLPPQ